MLDLTSHWAGILSLVIFVAAYILVVFEEATHLRKSKPVMLAAGLIWLLIGLAYAIAGRGEETYELSAHIIEEYGELFLFLLVAITYVNTLEERRGFEVLRAKLVSMGLSYRSLFLPHGRAVVLPVRHPRQPDDGPRDGHGGHGARLALAALRHHRLHLDRRGGQCGRRLHPLRRHHHP